MTTSSQHSEAEGRASASPSPFLPSDLSHYTVLDIETENTGVDIMGDNKRIISVQLGTFNQQELYYADAPEPTLTLDGAVSRMKQLLEAGRAFAGYNIQGFDIPLIQRFLGLSIPDESYLEIGSIGGLYAKRKAAHLPTWLEAVCSDFGIRADHKRLMNAKAEQLKLSPEVQARASDGAARLAKLKGWSPDFCQRYALNKIAGGYAILDAYLGFVRSGGHRDTLFYQYAVGDIVSESLLLTRLLGSGPL